MSEFAQAFRHRLLEQWQGRVISRDGEIYIVPPVREGGATDQFIDLAVDIADELHDEAMPA